MFSTTGKAPHAVVATALAAAALTWVPSASAHLATADAASVRGDVTFDCILDPFRSGFRYAGPATVSATPTADGEGMELTATLPDLPGIAPVAIEDGTMHVTLEGTMGGAPVELTATSSVTAEPKAEVPMPEVSGSVVTDVADPELELTGFGFAFDKMMNIEISADCEATDGGNMGVLDAEGDEAADAGSTGDADAGSNALASSSDDSLPLLAMWAIPIAVVVLGLVIWLPKRLRRT